MRKNTDIGYYNPFSLFWQTVISMKKIVILCWVSTLFVSCQWFYYSTPIRIKRGVTFKYDGIETGIDSLINITGYYNITGRFIVNDYYVNRKDTININKSMLFFKDGICAQERYSYIPKRDMSEYLRKVCQDDSLGIVNIFYEDFIWGRYLIFGDTIKVQYIERPILYSSDLSWWAMEVWYKVINNNTIIEIFDNPIGIS